MFNFLKHYQVIFQVTTSIYIPTRSVWGSDFFMFLTTLVINFFVVVVLMGVKWYLIVIWICVSLMTHDVKHLFMCLLAICISSLDKSLFRFFDHFLKLDYLFLYNWIISVPCKYMFARIFFHSVDCPQSDPNLQCQLNLLPFNMINSIV